MELLFVIWDHKNNLYWQKNIPYGYNYQNKAVFEARFTDNLEEATALPFEEISKVMSRFRDESFVMGGRFKAETNCLKVKHK